MYTLESARVCRHADLKMKFDSKPGNRDARAYSRFDHAAGEDGTEL